MKKFLSLIFLLILIPNILWAAAFTSKATGNWTTEGATTWNEAGHPGNGDTISIANAHVITVDVDHDIGTVTLEGGLTIKAGVTATASGIFTCGNGTSKDGTLTFGDATTGAILNIGTNNLVLNNCEIRTVGGSKSSMHQIISSGAPGGSITQGAVLTSPKTDVVLQYMSLRFGGAGAANMTFPLGITGVAGFTSQFDIDDSVIELGTGKIIIGHAGYTSASAKRTFDNVDFRIAANGTDFLDFKGSTGDNSANFYLKHCTMSDTTSKGNFRASSALDGITIDGNVLDLVGFSVAAIGAHGGGNVNFKNNLIYFPYFYAGSASGSAGAAVTRAGSSFNDNYFFWSNTNPHGIAMLGGTALAGQTWSMARNVAEIIPKASGASLLLVSTATTSNAPILNYQRNIEIGYGEGIALIAAYTGGQWTLTRNTFVVTSSDTTETDGLIFLIENDIVYTGTIIVENNNITEWGAGDATNITTKATAGSNQTIDTAGYNNLNWSGATKYGPRIVFTNDETANDLNVNPSFIDSSVTTGGVKIGRNMASFLPRRAGATTSAVTVKTQLDAAGVNLDVNGITANSYSYNGEPIGVTLDNGSIHWTKIASVTDADTIVLTDAIPTGRSANVGAAVWLAYSTLQYFLGINGYNSTNHDQSGTASTLHPSDMIEWVRYGYSPTNGTVRAGNSTYVVDSDSTIGAMQWQNPRRKRGM